MRLRLRSLLSVVTLAILALSSTSAFAALPAQDKGVVSRTISATKQREALKFWTRERLIAATALEMPVGTAAEAAAGAAAIEESAAAGPSGRSTAGAPAASVDAVLQAAYAEDWAAMEGDPALESSVDEEVGTSQVFTSYVANQLSSMQTIFPHRWFGRLSFSTPNGTSYCSATATSNNTIVTAAHCIYDTAANRFYSNWVFTPAFRNGNAPFGTFPARTCWVLNSYINQPGYSINGAAPHDVAVCKMNNNSAGVSLNSAVGWAGRSWNFSYVRHFHTVGYPFRNTSQTLLTNAGLYLRTCAAESFAQATEVRGMGCNWGGGISGGAWFIGYAPGVVGGWVDGVNSGIFVGQQNLYGPRFNSNNIVPLCTAAGC